MYLYRDKNQKRLCISTCIVDMREITSCLVLPVRHMYIISYLHDSGLYLGVHVKGGGISYYYNTYVHHHYI